MANCLFFTVEIFSVFAQEYTPKVGAAISLLNTSLIGQPLLHSVNACGPAAVIVGGDCVDAISSIRAQVGVLFIKFIFQYCSLLFMHR